MVDTGATSYDDMTQSEATGLDFSLANDVIAGNWRSVFTHVVYDYRYFIIKDVEGNYYKIQFLGLLNEDGIRGYPSFKYELLK